MHVHLCPHAAATAASVRLTINAAYGSDKPSVGQIRNIISNIGPSADTAASVRFTLEGK